MYRYEELMELWKTGRITTEQAMGQVILHINEQRHEQREENTQQRRRIQQLELQVLALQTRLDPPDAPDAPGGRPVKR